MYSVIIFCLLKHIRSFLVFRSLLINSCVAVVCFDARVGPGCTWKPRCRYVHMEDGETIPPRAYRAGGRGHQVKNCHWSAAECPRGGPTTCTFAHLPELINQGFPTSNFAPPPPRVSMAEFPVLPAPRRPSVFKLNPQNL